MGTSCRHGPNILFSMIAFLGILPLPLQASRMAVNLAVMAHASIEATSTVLLKGHVLLTILQHNIQLAIQVFFVVYEYLCLDALVAM